MIKRNFTIIGLMICLISSIVFLQSHNFIHQKEVFETIENEVLFVPDGKKLKSFSFGFENLMTDLVWLKTVQYIGGNARSQDYHLLGEYLESVTDIDPYFYTPYWVALILLPDRGDSEAAIQLAEKGMQALPERWEIPYYAGYVYYFYLNDYEKGAEMYTKAAKLPGVLSSAERMAINLKSKSGKHLIALEMWLDVYDNTDNPAMRELIEQKILREKNFLDLEKAVKTYEKEKGTLPESLKKIVELGFLSEIPQDPIEYWKEYVLENGVIVLK